MVVFTITTQLKKEQIPILTLMSAKSVRKIASPIHKILGQFK